MSLLQLQAEMEKFQMAVFSDGIELVGKSENDLRKIRWDGISIVFKVL